MGHRRGRARGLHGHAGSGLRAAGGGRKAGAQVLGGILFWVQVTWTPGWGEARTASRGGHDGAIARGGGLPLDGLVPVHGGRVELGEALQ